MEETRVLEKDRVAALTKLIKETADRWMRITEIKDLGDLGKGLEGYTQDGYRQLTPAEKRILKICFHDIDRLFRGEALKS